MNKDAIERLALERAVKISIDIETQFDKNAKLQPMAIILGLAKAQAATAMRGLVFCDPNDKDKVREFQNEVRRYDDLVDWIHKLLVDGREADRRLAELDRQDFADILLDPELQAERDELRGERTQED